MRKLIYDWIRKIRMKRISNLIIHRDVTDIGTPDNLLRRYLDDTHYERFDLPTNVENLPFKDNSKECVVCCEVLEHVNNPVRAIKELERVYSKQLIISVPYEPLFSITRLGWEKEHLWAITPKVLKNYLGKPVHEEIFLGRYYIGVWEK